MNPNKKDVKRNLLRKYGQWLHGSRFNMSAFLAFFGAEWLNCIGNISIVSQQLPRRTWIIHRALLHDMVSLLVFLPEKHYAERSAVRPSLSPCVVEGGQLSHHPLGEEGWAGRGRAERSHRGRSALMNLIYLWIRMGVGLRGGEVLFTCPIKMPLKPPLLQECHTGSPWDRCVGVCVCICTHICCVVHCFSVPVVYRFRQGLLFHAAVLKLFSLCLLMCIFLCSKNQWHVFLILFREHWIQLSSHQRMWDHQEETQVVPGLPLHEMS